MDNSDSESTVSSANNFTARFEDCGISLIFSKNSRGPKFEP